MYTDKQDSCCSFGLLSEVDVRGNKRFRVPNTRKLPSLAFWMLNTLSLTPRS